MSNPRAPKAAIFGCAGPFLGVAERDFFRTADPLGFILFQRNCADPEQVRALVADLRACVGRPNAPVLIDQEGGRVQRLKPPQWRAAPPAARFAELAQGDPAAAARATWINARLIAADLADLGIDVDCAPVLDNPVPGAHDVIGDRAYGTDPRLIAHLGRAVVQGLMAGGVFPVIKHLPGHGRAEVDSHEHCPVVHTSAADLLAADVPSFRALADAPYAMTAHVVYTAWDADRVATLSPVVVGKVIRGVIGFDGLLMSDDLSMKALAGTLGDRARLSIEAGCDVVLHCNGKMDEMVEVAVAVGPMDDKATARFARVLAARVMPDPIDRAGLLGELDGLLGGHA